MEAHVPQVTHEAERFSRLQIAFTAGWVLIFCGLLGVIAVLVFNARSRSQTHVQTQAVHATTPPRGEVSNIHVDLFAPTGKGQALKGEQEKKIASYGWVDPKAGLVRIPIDVAMDLELREHR
jgi:uncharacterized protein YpmB